MKRTAIAVLVLACSLLLGTRADAAEDARHALLFYTKTTHGVEVLTPEIARRMVAYVAEDGTAIDWMCDGVIFYSHDMYQGTAPDELQAYHDYLFADGGLQMVANAVQDLRTELDDPDYRLKVYLTAPLSFPNGPPNANDNVDDLYDAYQVLDPPELELVGFYWGHREDLAGVESYEAQTAAHVHGLGLQFVWIPSWAWDDPTPFTDYGFDRAALQPNHHTDDTADWGRFEDVEIKIILRGLSGAEFEIAEADNVQLAEPKLLNNARAYFRAADHYNWTERRWNVWYYGPRMQEFEKGEDRRTIYDEAFRVIAAHPRKSVARREQLAPVADSFTETYGDRIEATNGGETWLDVGTNGLGNETQTYVKFELPDSAIVPLAAHLRLELIDIVEASFRDPADVYLCTSDWDEMTIAGNNQPSCESTPLGSHRFHLDAPRTHHFDVTDEVRAASAGPITFMIKGRNTSPIGIAMLHSREAEGDGVQPSLTIVYPGPEPEQPPTDGGVGGSGAGSVTGGGGAGAMGTGGGLLGSDADSEGGCGCRVGRRSATRWAARLWLLGLLLARRRRQVRREG